MNNRISLLETMLAKGPDNALLRYSLGSEYLKENHLATAIEHFSKAVELDPNYSSAWKGYAKALAENKQIQEAIEIYTQGIKVAEQRKDYQAAKEMRVFLKRLQ